MAENVVITDMSSFESGMDGWANVGSRFFFRKVGSTTSSGTGPPSAADGSYYVYAETSNNYNKNFELEKTFPPGQSLYGIAFQYHMYGATMGSVVLESSADGTSWLNLWSKSGNLGNQWLQAAVYADKGQKMLRYRCVRNGALIPDTHKNRTIIATPTPRQVHVGIKLHW